MQRLLARPLLSMFSTVLPPLGEPDEEALGPALLPADSCRTAGIETNGSAQNSPVCCRVQQTSLALKQRFLDCGLSRQRDSRLFRAPGPPGDQADDRLEEACGCRPHSARQRRAPCTASLATCYVIPDVTWIETHDAARARGGLRSSHDGQLTVLYCVPTNPGPRSFHAWALRRCHWPDPQPIVQLLKPYSNLGPPIFRPPKVHEPVPNISRSRISRPQRVHL